MNIAVLGSGSWGTALAKVLWKNGHNVFLWASNSEKADKMNEDRICPQLPCIKIPNDIVITNDESCAEKAEIIILAVSSKHTRSVCERFKNYFKQGQIIVNVAKGIENGTLLRLSQVIKQTVPSSIPVVLSGPSHAEEVALGMATAVVVSCENEEVAKKIQDIFMNKVFRIYINCDIIGVELGGALKNLIALAAGVSDGMGLGDNAKAALITRGMEEISRLGIAMGAKRDTFSGLSGIGDLIVTCTSMHSRNRQAGILLGQGKTIKEALEQVKMVVEGFNTAKAAYDLSIKYNVNMPITTEIYNCLFNNADPKLAVYNLMTRDKTVEHK